MSDLKRLEEALGAAAAAGDVAAAKALAAEIRNSLQRENPRLGMPEPVVLGQAGMPSAIRDAVRSESRPSQAYAGAGSALSLAAHGVDQLVPGAITTQQQIGLPGPMVVPKPDSSADVQNWQALSRASPSAIGGNLAGNAALFAALPTRFGARMPVLSSRPGMVADTAITGGILNAATTPGGVQERGTTGILSMASGGIPALYTAGAAGRRTVTRAGKRIEVGEGLRAELGDAGADRLLASLQQPDPGVMLGVQSSAAMRSGQPTLEVLETGSRASRGDLWRDFDRQNAASRWSALATRAGTPEDLAVLKRARDTSTGAIRSEALDNAQITAQFTGGNVVSEPILRPMNRLIEGWRSGAMRPNKDVQTLADYLEGELKQGITPEQMYEVRKVLTEGVKAGRTDQLSSSIKAARSQRMEAVGLIDDALENLSGGGWKEYLQKYAAASPPITSKQALQDVASALQRGQPEGAVPTSMGESAAWRTVGNLRDRFGEKQLGSVMFDRLTPEDRTLLNTLVDNLKRQSDVMSARGVLGSHTAPLLANAQRAGGITGILAQSAERAVPFGGVLSASAFNSLGRKAEEELARLLQDPIALAAALAAAKRAQAVAGASSRAGAATGAGYSRSP